MSWRAAVCVAAATLSACGRPPDRLTFSGSVLGTEGAVVRRQIARFEAEHGVRVEVRPTPDAADQRHQLYVQWLNAWSTDPDILQLDVIWTPEFAAAGWIKPLDEFGIPAGNLADFFDATLRANRWNGRLYAVPWFVDAGMLYWRTDLMPAAPVTFRELEAVASRVVESGNVTAGFVWQGARYEGLVTVFLEHLAGFGGAILSENDAVVVDSPAGVRALTFMRDSIFRDRIVPEAVLTWQEEQVRFAFQNGRAAFMRNWPYAAALLRRPGESSVAGRFAVAPMPREEGRPAAALGGAQLAINARSRQPDEAWALVQYLTAPEQMLERAEGTGQFPSRRSLYANPRLADALPIPPAIAQEIVEHALPRPTTPLYSQLSGILQIQLHRALTRQASPEDALRAAADSMRRILATAGLTKAGS
jgi:ABC-type glycerol-3-phosphate transport system substrate-binding protein